MKRPDDPRHLRRVHLIKQLFSYSFSAAREFAPEVTDIMAKQALMDAYIQQCAPEWPISQINRIDLSILRLAVFELIEDKTPTKVVIDEAVELAKEFGTESSPKFVNGVLGSVVNLVKKSNTQNQD